MHRLARYWMKHLPYFCQHLSYFYRMNSWATPPTNVIGIMRIIFFREQNSVESKRVKHLWLNEMCIYIHCSKRAVSRSLCSLGSIGNTSSSVRGRLLPVVKIFCAQLSKNQWFKYENRPDFCKKDYSWQQTSNVCWSQQVPIKLQSART